MAGERLCAVPMDFEGANEFVDRHHRHHDPVVGHKFSIGAALGDLLVGVVMVGRPVSRHRDDGDTLEVTRLATDGIKYPTGRVNRRGEATFHNPCSFLYGAAARAAFALGYRRIGTYIRADEPGHFAERRWVAADRRNTGPLMVGPVAPPQGQDRPHSACLALATPTKPSPNLPRGGGRWVRN